MATVKDVIRSPSKRLPLVARVLSKSGLHFYGKPEDTSAASGGCPFQFFLSVGDATGRLKVVFRMTTAKRYYNHINDDTILLNSGYRLKKNQIINHNRG